ncbi:uncharacterized protein LOC114464234 [Gouania willdenowi]|uniref:uncharacterized protein LOC114464234 n=1 Tax=Gouania willdenowi TaxID=441366 RepID=UPI001056D108|nr:uncharacterized protein LOC114464234 [Gouania willdenowi]
MGLMERLCFAACLFQALLSCEQPVNPAVVQLLFPPSPSSYTLTLRAAGNLVYSGSVDGSACSPDCELSLRVFEGPLGYNMTLRTSRRDGELQEQNFAFYPVSSSSFHVHATTTTVLLMWKLKSQQRLLTLTLFNIQTQSVSHFFNINSSEIKSQYKVKGVQPETRFRAEVVVVSFLADLQLTFSQKLSFLLETAHCSVGWLANGRSCYSVRRAERTWSVAQRTCSSLISGGHLADLKIPEDRLLVSSHLLTSDDLLMQLWAGLHDPRLAGSPHLHEVGRSVNDSAPLSPPVFDHKDENSWSMQLS